MLGNAILRRLAPALWRAYVLRLRLLGAVTIGAKVLVGREGHVLLLRQTYRPGWYLPGGGARPGESLAHCARRELREEVGLRLGPLRLLGLYSGRSHGITDHIALFAGEPRDESPAHSWEVAEWRWFPLHDLPPAMAPADRRHTEHFRAGTPPTHGRW